MREFMAAAKALADENRVRVLLFLRGGKELCLCQIVEMLGLAPSTVSKHMAVLYQAGLVESRKEGRWIYYRLPGSGRRRASAARSAGSRRPWPATRRSLPTPARWSKSARCRKRNSAPLQGVTREHNAPRSCSSAPATPAAARWPRPCCKSTRATGLRLRAGIERHGMNPRAVRVMAEAGVDIAGPVRQGRGHRPGHDTGATTWSPSAARRPRPVRCFLAGVAAHAGNRSGPSTTRRRSREPRRRSWRSSAGSATRSTSESRPGWMNSSSHSRS